MPEEAAVASLRELQLEVDEEFGTAQAEFCGALLGTRRDLGLSLQCGLHYLDASLDGLSQPFLSIEADCVPFN